MDLKILFLFYDGLVKAFNGMPTIAHKLRSILSAPLMDTGRNFLAFNWQLTDVNEKTFKISAIY